MPHFIQVFFEQHPGEFPFLTYEETIADFYNNRLTPILANAIAAMAVQWVHSCFICCVLVADYTVRLGILISAICPRATSLISRRVTQRLRG